MRLEIWHVKFFLGELIFEKYSSDLETREAALVANDSRLGDGNVVHKHGSEQSKRVQTSYLQSAI